jgi:O-antigen/teichoic acid export membrane protein
MPPQKIGITTPLEEAAALRRGALINFVGGIAKLAHPLSLLLVTWLWGPAVAGLYLLGQSLMEIFSGGITAGYSDATVIFASRHVDGASESERERAALYRVFANTFLFTVGASTLVALVTAILAPVALSRFFPSYVELSPGIYWLSFALVPRAAALVAIAGTKSMMRMEHDALLYGAVHPLCSVLGFFVTYLSGGGLTALFAVQLVVESVLCVFALRAFSLYFSFAELRGAFSNFQYDRALLVFAVPQSVNLTFNRYITRLDSIMLAAFGLGQVELGYFGTVAFLTSNLGQLRTVFSGAVAPLLARYHARGERQSFEDLLGKLARWGTSLVVPAALLVAVLREDILHLISASYGHDSEFALLLLVPAFTNCAYGMAGACLMFTGHSKVTLGNSAAVALLNTALNYLTIPRFGMLGAALSTVIASSFITGLQMVELWSLERVRIRFRAVWKPHVGLGAALAVFCVLGDPARLSPTSRIVTALLLMAGYGLLMLSLNLEELAPWRRALLRLRQQGPLASTDGLRKPRIGS